MARVINSTVLSNFSMVNFDSSQEEQSFREYTRKLGYGEASCLALARHRRWLVLTDDRTARRMLRQEGLEVTGTIGILKLATERGLLTLEEANILLGEMIRGGYHSPYERLEDLL